MKPLKNNVLILPEEKKTETSSGIYTGAYSLEGSLRRGTVVAVGDNVKELKEGDYVCFQVFVGRALEVEGVRHMLVLEEEVIGFVHVEV